MTTITIPKNLIKEKDLIVIPRKEYEALLAEKKKINQFKVKRSVSFKVPKKNEKFYEKLDKDLTKTLKDVKNGKFIGPFSNVKESKIFFDLFQKSRKMQKSK